MNSLQQTITSHVLTLQEVHNKKYQFYIPSYQRPYTWTEDDVEKLFNDIYQSMISEEPHYFIGTVISAKDPKNANSFELIDGQQRTTTLMLIALAFKKAGVKVKLVELAVLNQEPRLHFAIREPVRQLLGAWAKLQDFVHPNEVEIKDNFYLKPLAVALNVLTKLLQKLPEKRQKELGDYIYKNVQWVNNVVPHEMDLNRLFASMNTTGVQLEQADLLKSKLLKKIKTDKPIYDAIWQASAHLDNYFERNVRQLFPKADWNALTIKDLAQFNRQVFCPRYRTKAEESSKQGLSIKELVNSINSLHESDNAQQIEEANTDVIDDEVIYCRSIVSFPLLLIHAYRCFCALQEYEDIEPRLNADRLLEIFEPLTELDEDDIKGFIEYLWQVRYQFDLWVVKWVEHVDQGEKHLQLTTQTRSKTNGKYYINRTPKAVSALSMLQSVRNFTGERSAQYWLTPFLAQLINQKESTENQVLKILERIDNELSLSKNTQKEASFEQAGGWELNIIPWSEQEAMLKEPKGTRFEHYWFQKLEYILWKHADITKDSKLKTYRIVSRNSIEHVYPQNEEYLGELDEDHLHAFGNLVLLSPSENSTYSNQAVKKKKVDFERKPHYDSLKLKAIFELMGKGEWDEKGIEKHQKQMLKMMESHYAETIKE